MADSKPEVQRLLEQLRTELQSLDREGGASHRLTELSDRIERQLDSELATSRADALVGELSDELTEFEVNHPTLAGIVQNLIRMLGNIGV